MYRKWNCSFLGLKSWKAWLGWSCQSQCSCTLELREVVALFSRVSLSLSSTGWAMLVSTSIPLSRAFWNDSEMMVGWIPGQSKKNACWTLHTFKHTFFFLFFFIISFHFKTQDTQVRINWRHFSRMFFTSIWPPLLFSAVKTERKSFNIPSDLSYQTSPASFPAIPDIPEILSPSSLGILKAAAVQLMPVRRLTMVKFQAFKNCFPIVLYETPQFPWSVGYSLYPSNWLTATSSFIPHMQEDKKTSVPTISAW